VGSAGILGHVATDGTGGLTRRVWHIVETQRLHRLREPSIDDARLEDGAALDRIDAEDPVQARQRDQHRIRVGQGPPRKAGPSAPGYERDLHQME
jgi:hypothetical protein